MSQCPEDTPNEYIPLYLQQTAKENQVIIEANIDDVQCILIETFDGTDTDAPILLYCIGKIAILSIYSSRIGKQYE